LFPCDGATTRAAESPRKPKGLRRADAVSHADRLLARGAHASAEGHERRHRPSHHREAPDAIVLVELDEIDAAQRLVAHLGLEYESEQQRLDGTLFREKVRVAELVAGRLDRAQRASNRLLADHRLIRGRIEHHDVRCQLRRRSLDIMRSGRLEKSLGRVHATAMMTLAAPARQTIRQ
jgi:hypothetical protein